MRVWGGMLGLFTGEPGILWDPIRQVKDLGLTCLIRESRWIERKIPWEETETMRRKKWGGGQHVNVKKALTVSVPMSNNYLWCNYLLPWKLTLETHFQEVQYTMQSRRKRVWQIFQKTLELWKCFCLSESEFVFIAQTQNLLWQEGSYNKHTDFNFKK